MQIQLHDDLEDYSEEEKLILTNAYNELEVKAQEGNLTIDETRIRVAYVRLQREENFRISQPTIRAASTRKKKEPSLEQLFSELSGTKAERPKRIAKEKTVKAKNSVAKAQQESITRAGMLFFKRNRGEILSEEENTFLDIALETPEVL